MSAFDEFDPGTEGEMKNSDGFELFGKCFAWNEWRSDSFIVGIVKVLVDIVMTCERWLPDGIVAPVLRCAASPGPLGGCVVILVFTSNAEGEISVCKSRDLPYQTYRHSELNQENPINNKLFR